MPIVHHLGNSQSERIVWLCEELGVPYELKVYDRDKVSRLAPPEYKALHPIGAAPVINDGDVVLAESGAVVEYITTKYGPKDGRGRLDLALGLVEARLGKVEYFAGREFTTADIMIVFTLTTMRLFLPYDLKPYPAILAYLQRIGRRDAYRRATRKGDPDIAPVLT